MRLFLTTLPALLLANQPPTPDDDFTRRFPPTGPEAPAPAPEGRVDVEPEVTPTRPASEADPTTCNDVSPDERLACPLSEDNVTRVANIPTGARLMLVNAKGPLAPARLQKVLECQASLAWARPQAPPPCPFLTTQARFEVRASKGKTIVDVKTATPELDPMILRKRIQVAVGKRGK
jgi:hypothetical protein